MCVHVDTFSHVVRPVQNIRNQGQLSTDCMRALSTTSVMFNLTWIQDEKHLHMFEADLQGVLKCSHTLDHEICEAPLFCADMASKT